MLRVVAGRFKGRRLATPRWAGLRPTSDRLRETLFNILAPRIGGARVLDGFAGTGALGIEALSRGAAHVTFAESDRRAVALTTGNLARCGATDGYTICAIRIGSSVAPWAEASFDLVLLDPPYEDPDIDAYLALAARWLAPGGLVVLEHAARRAVPARAGGLERRRSVRAGDSALAFYARAEGAEAAAASSGAAATGGEAGDRTDD
ncbi:MAG: 16S rRNA (guanine(966)-N(2))-methyltransferase RsmD [Vicinamibacteraceae bacterium]|nr:16S rRNA (guanine(966)-N(2))-methyltransferase RsmD [Vicinamibacteraceae bacterium]